MQKSGEIRGNPDSTNQNMSYRCGSSKPTPTPLNGENGPWVARHAGDTTLQQRLVSRPSDSPRDGDLDARVRECERGSPEGNVPVDENVSRALGGKFGGSDRVHVGSAAETIDEERDAGVPSRRFFFRSAVDAKCEVTLGVTPVSLRESSYNARFRCHSIVQLR